MKQKNKKRNPLRYIISNWFIALIQIIASVLISYGIITLNILPSKYLSLFFVILVLGNLLYMFFLFNKRKGVRNLGKVLSVLISAAMFFGSFQMIYTNSFVKGVTGGSEDTHVIFVMVLKEDKSAKKLEDLKDDVFAYNDRTDQEYIKKTLEEIDTKLKTTVEKKNYSSNDDLVQGLYDKDERAILLSEAQRSLILDIYPDFNDMTKIIYESHHKETVDINQGKPPVNVLKDTFTVFISGIDTYGPVSTVSRSDVNMLMTVNPVTNQILLTSIPRDYYVTLSNVGEKDKLTHAGNFGVETSVKTLENLFEINIDYFVKVNFSSLTRIVDALGGITVESQFAFQSGAGQNIVKGENYLNGTQALAFVRERYKLPDGDDSRILNQQAALTGILNKALSPAIILNYNSFLQSIDGSFVLSMPENDFKSLIRNQVDTMASWEILDQAVGGTGKSSVTYSYPTRPLYVKEPDMDSVRQAHDKIEAMERGDRISE